jgi:hypothetical protein
MDGRPASGASGPALMTSRAPESVSWWAASVAVNAGLTGVAVAPSRQAANSTSTSSTRFGNITATTSPASTPWARSCAAVTSTRSANSPQVSDVVSSATQGWSRRATGQVHGR